MSQAAVSEHADNAIPSGVTEESAVCSLPGEFASVRKLFETQQTADSHSVTQFQFQQRTVQQMSESEVVVSSSSRQTFPGSEPLDCNQQTMVSYSSSNLESSYENHQNETEEEFPRYTTKELRAHFERTIEEAAPQKPIKVRVPRSELCTVCRRRAYPMDALMVDKKKYHKSCFCCEHCRNKLSLGNYVSLHGRFYCLPHYKQLHQSKGSFENGLGQNPPTRSAAPLPTDEKPVCRYSVSGLNSLEKAHIGTTTGCDESRPQSHKIAVVWPPQDDSPKKAFQIEEDIQLIKPQWPPPHNSPKSPKHQHRKAVPRSIL